MKIWLDDVRIPPDFSWIWVQDARDFFDYLERYQDEITEISFDHDIASFDSDGNEITGYHCLCAVEKIAMNSPEFKIPKMQVHSANPVGIMKMRKAIEAINRR